MSKMNEIHQTISELLVLGQHTLFEIAIIVGVTVEMVQSVHDSLMTNEEDIYYCEYA